MGNENALRASELAEILQKELSIWNVIATEDCSRALANACFDYIGPKLEVQLQEGEYYVETIRD